ncbi:MAG: radical SAM protein [Candidatus Aenigmarchaeota archaeon]|nr:radical SAM protein [Candidatus Aenigmarchaeota archaeon]
MYKVDLRFTNACPVLCRHCAYDSRPAGKTMENREMESVIENLSPATTIIMLTGGEPFYRKGSLMHALEHLAELRKDGFFHTDPKIHIQTSGYWIKNEKQAYDEVKNLANIGVNKIMVTSDDIYHRERGIEYGNLLGNNKPISDIAVRLYDEGWRGFDVYGVPVDNKKHPFGRAKSLSRKAIRKSSSCMPHGMFADESGDKYVTIDPYGRVHLCLWEIPPSIGSALETPVDDLIASALNDPVMVTLVTEGLGETAKKLGVFDKKLTEKYEENPCSMCESTFSNANFGPGRNK